MGHNIDLQWLLGLPDVVQCPRCQKHTRTYFEEYDIDCGDPSAKEHVMHLTIQCGKCGEDFDFEVNIHCKGDVK